MLVRYWHAALLTLAVLYGLSGCSGSYKYDDNTYRPVGDPQTDHRGE